MSRTKLLAYLKFFQVYLDLCAFDIDLIVEKRKNMGRTLGYMDYDDSYPVITISNKKHHDINDTTQEETLLHEMLHIKLFKYGFSLKKDEELVIELTKTMFPMLKKEFESRMIKHK